MPANATKLISIVEKYFSEPTSKTCSITSSLCCTILDTWIQGGERVSSQNGVASHPDTGLVRRGGR